MNDILKPNRTGPNMKLKDKGTTLYISDPIKFVTKIKTYFDEIAEDLTSETPVSSFNPLSQFDTISKTVVNFDTCFVEIKNIVFVFKPKNSISSKFHLSHTNTSMILYLTLILFNESVRLVCFPSCLKLARTVPINISPRHHLYVKC